MEERCKNKRLDPECLETDGLHLGTARSRAGSRAELGPARSRRNSGTFELFFFFFRTTGHREMPENGIQYFYLALDFRQLKIFIFDCPRCL